MSPKLSHLLSIRWGVVLWPAQIGVGVWGTVFLEVLTHHLLFPTISMSNIVARLGNIVARPDCATFVLLSPYFGHYVLVLFYMGARATGPYVDIYICTVTHTGFFGPGCCIPAMPIIMLRITSICDHIRIETLIV